MAYRTHFKCAVLTQKGKENLNKVVNLFCTMIKYYINCDTFLVAKHKLHSGLIMPTLVAII